MNKRFIVLALKEPECLMQQAALVSTQFFLL